MEKFLAQNSEVAFPIWIVISFNVIQKQPVKFGRMHFIVTLACWRRLLSKYASVDSQRTEQVKLLSARFKQTSFTLSHLEWPVT